MASRTMLTCARAVCRVESRCCPTANRTGHAHDAGMAGDAAIPVRDREGHAVSQPDCLICRRMDARQRQNAWWGLSNL